MVLHWFPKNEMIEFLCQQKREKKRHRETEVVWKSQGTQKYKGKSRRHLHARGPGCVFLIFYATEGKHIALFHCRKRNNSFHFIFKGVFTKGISARNGVKMVVPAVLSWETKLKKPQRKRNCSMTNKKSKSCVSLWLGVYVSSWLNRGEWMDVSVLWMSGHAGRCVHLWRTLPSLGKPFQTNACLPTLKDNKLSCQC